MDKRHLALCLALLGSLTGRTSASETVDNRLPKSAVGVVFHIAPPDEVEVLQLIRDAQKPGLSKAMHGLRMEWHGQISLKDADYYLYLFDSVSRINPGTTQRVLVLLDLRRHLKTWAVFDANLDAFFGYGAIVQQTGGPKTYFITVNSTDWFSHFHNALFFEKYAIFPDRIEKLGEGLELTALKD
jgi:hypothetical protein